MPAKLIDCLTKAVKADLLTQEESDFVQRRAKEFPGMSRQDAEIAAARSMLQDGITELNSIRSQLGKGKPIAESKVILRTTNKDAALVAMMDETQAVVENQILKQAQALQGDEGVLQAAQAQAEEGILSEGFSKETFYHGSTESFDVFSLEKRGSATKTGDAKEAFFFSDSPKYAEHWTYKEGEKVGTVKPFRLKIQNPLTVDNGGQYYRPDIFRKAIAEAKAAGHDAVVIENVRDPATEKIQRVVAVFDPGQIEAAEAPPEGPHPSIGTSTTKQKATPRAVDRQAEITSAVERLNKQPGERLQVYAKIRDTLVRTMRANKIEIAGMEFERGMTPEERAQAGIKKAPEQHEIQREKMLAAMGELNALLKFLPPVVRGKVGGFFQLAQGGLGETELADFFTQRIKMVEREVERLLRSDYTAQIEKLFKQSKPVVAPNKIQTSKIGDSQAAVDIARNAAEMTADEAAQELASIESQLTNPDLTDEEQSVLQGKWAIVNAFGDLSHRNAETLATAHAWLTDTIARGRSEWGEKEERRLEQVRGWAIGITEGLPQVTQAGTASLEWEQKLTQLGDSFILSHFSFAQALEHLLPPGHPLIKRWSDRARKADNASQDFIRKASDRLTERVKEAIGSDNKLKVGNALWHLKQVVPGPVPMTRLQAIQTLLSWNQPDVRERMEKDGWTEETAEHMRSITSDELSQSITEFLREEYEKGFSTINAVYRRMYGMDMPRVLNYAPTSYHHAGTDQDIGLYGGPLAVSGLTPSFAKTRTPHNAKLRLTDALTVYWQHTGQMAHWTQYAELLREMRGVLGNPDVKLALKQRYGSATTQILDKWMDALARQGGNKAAELQVNEWFIDGLLSAKAVSALGLNARSVAMQVDSLARMTLAIPMRRVIAAIFDPKFIETIPKAWHSDAIQRRVQGGASPEARYLFERARAKPSAMLELARISMLPIQYVDGYLTSFSSAVVFTDAYNEAIKNGMNEAQAETVAADQMEDAVFRYSQPMGIASRSLQEVSGSQLKKVFLMFMSDPRLKSAIMADSIRSLVTGKGDAGTHLRRLVAIEAMAMLSQLVSNLYRDWFSDDDDDEIWTWQGFGMAGMLAPLSGWFIWGTVGSALMGDLFAERAFVPSRDPAVEAAQRLIRGKKNLDDMFNTDDPAAMLREWDNIARSLVLLGPIGGPVPAGLAIVINFLKPLVGRLEDSENKE